MMTRAKKDPEVVPEPEVGAAPSAVPAASETAPLGPVGDGGVGPVATDPVSEHDAEVQALVNQALAEQQERHDDELREVTAAKRGADVPGKPQTRPMALGSSKRVKVMAVQLGYYNHKRQRPGDVFWIKDEAAFSDAHRPGPRAPGWMERVPITTPERTTTATEALRAEHGRIRDMAQPPIVEATDAPTGGVDVMGTERK